MKQEDVAAVWGEQGFIMLVLLLNVVLGLILYSAPLSMPLQKIIHH